MRSSPEQCDDDLSALSVSTFSDKFEALGLPPLFDKFGEAVQYLVTGEDAVDLTAIVGAESTEVVDGEHGQVRVRTRTVTISRDASGDYGGVAAVSDRGAFTINSERWAVDGKESETAESVVVRVVRRVSIEKTKAGHRISR